VARVGQAAGVGVGTDAGVNRGALASPVAQLILRGTICCGLRSIMPRECGEGVLQLRNGGEAMPSATRLLSLIRATGECETMSAHRGPQRILSELAWGNVLAGRRETADR
jgi:hypothetical protein